MTTTMSKQFIYLKDLVPVVEKILILQADVDSKQAAIDAATAELATMPSVGHRQTIARCKIRDAETARDAIATEMYSIIDTIPAPTEIQGSFFVQHIAELLITRRAKRATLKENTDSIDAELEVLKSGPWRRRDAPLPPAIVRLQTKGDDIQAQISKIDRQIAEMVGEMEEFDKMTRDSEEMERWFTVPGTPTPKRVIDREQRELEDIIRNSVVLKLPKISKAS
jgi:hypothetical protein